MITDDKIQAYIDGELDDAEVLAFKKELDSDPSLQKKYESYLFAKDLSKGLLEIDMRSTLENETVSKQPLSKWIWLGILLGLALAVLFWYNSNGKSKDILYAEMYTEPLWPITRSSEDSLSSALAKWKKTGDIQQAKSEILDINSIDITTKNYWIAEIFLNVKELDSVAIYLPEIQKDHMSYGRFQKIKTLLIEYNK